MNSHPLRLLLIEDNPADANLLRIMLLDAAPQIAALHIEETLAAGIAAAKRQIFSIILLDLSLPDSFGLDTLRQIQQAAPHLPIIVLTGHQDVQQGLEAVQAGAQDYLIKGEVSAALLVRAMQYAFERNRTQTALRRSEEAYRSLINDVFDNSAVGIFILDQHEEVVWVNHATELYFGLSRDQMLGQNKRALVRDRLACLFADPDAYADTLLDAYDRDDFSGRFECHVRGDDQRADRWLEHWSQPIRSGIYAGGRIEHYADITARKEAESALQLVAAIDERQRIARELHDSVTQSIFSGKVMAESALRQWDINPPKARDLVEQVHQLVSGALSELRILLLELRPQSILQVDLRQLVELLMNSVRGHRQIDLNLAMGELPPLPQDVQIALYRIVQEALNNIIKHAQAAHVTVSLHWTNDDELILCVEDDGLGFDVAETSPSSLGLSIMRERADSIHARLELDSMPGHGTRLTVRWQGTLAA